MRRDHALNFHEPVFPDSVGECIELIVVVKALRQPVAAEMQSEQGEHSADFLFEKTALFSISKQIKFAI